MSKKKERGKKASALTIATAMIVFALETASTGEHLVAAAALVIGAGLFGVYTVLEERGRDEKFNELVDELGEDTFRELSEASADEIRRLLREYTDGGKDRK